MRARSVYYRHEELAKPFTICYLFCKIIWASIRNRLHEKHTTDIYEYIYEANVYSTNSVLYSSVQYKKRRIFKPKSPVWLVWTFFVNVRHKRMMFDAILRLHLACIYSVLFSRNTIKLPIKGSHSGRFFILLSY